MDNSLNEGRRTVEMVVFNNSLNIHISIYNIASFCKNESSLSVNWYGRYNCPLLNSFENKY